MEALRTRYGECFGWFVLFTLTAGAVSFVISAIIVNVAIPGLSWYFMLGQGRAQWVSISFMAAMTLSMLLTPWLLLRFRLRRTSIDVLLLLGVDRLTGGLSPNYEVMIVMRAVEGAAVGTMQPLPSILILRVFPEQEQGKAFGLFSFDVVLAPVVGLNVGGSLVELFGWHSIFSVVMPLMLIGWAMTRRFMVINSPMAGEPRPLDWRGLLLIGDATVILLDGLVALHGDAMRGIALILISAMCPAGSVFWQWRIESPLLNLRLFGYRQLTTGVVMTFIYGAGLHGSTYLVSVYMQMTLAYASSRVGLVLLSAGLMPAVTVMLTGRLTNRIEPFRLMSFGLAALVLSFFLMTTNTRATGYPLLITVAVIGRVRLGFVLPSLSLGAMCGVGLTLTAQGSSAVNFLHRLGGAISVSTTGISLQWRLATRGVGIVYGTAIDPDARILASDEMLVLLGMLCALAVLAAWHVRHRALPSVIPVTQ